MRIFSILIVVFGVAFSGIVSGQNIFSCKDVAGKVLFTDNVRHCDAGYASSEEIAEELNIESTNIHSQYGESVSEEYHTYSFREYEEIPGYKIRVIAEKKLIREQPELLEKAIKKLEKAVSKAINSYPAHVRHEFKDVKYYLFSGEESRTGGRKGGQLYFRKGNLTSARFDNSVVIRSAKDYLNHYSDERAAQTATHELGHAYYHYHRDRIVRAVIEAFKNADKNGLYLNVKHKNGGVVEKGYAMKNSREYFAELCKIFNKGSYYYPFNAAELKEYDPLGYGVVKDAYFYKNVERYQP